MEFVIGFGGALVCLILFGAGIAIGWRLKLSDEKRTQRVTAEQLTEKQRQALREEQEAWRVIHNYNVETAYSSPANDKSEKE